MQFRIAPCVLAVLLIALIAPALTPDSQPPAATGAASSAGQSTIVTTPVRLVRTEVFYDGDSVYSCGNVSCSYYMDRRATKAVADAVGRYQNLTTAVAGGVFATACSLTGAGGVAVTLCASAGAAAGSLAVDQFVAAGNRGECIRMYYYYIPDPFNAGEPFLPVSPPTLTPDTSGYCRNG